MRVAGLQQGRGKECALGHTIAPRGEAIAGAEQLITALQQAAHPLGHVVLLVVGGQGAHAYAFQRRVTHYHLAQTLAQARGNGVDVFGRHDGAADGGALLPGFGGHFTHHLLDVQVELFAVRGNVRAEDRAVQRVRLGGEGHRVADQVRRDTQFGCGIGGTGEGHHVLALKAVEQVAGAADHQLQAASRQ
ncbi:hypothetical protein D3C76_1044090 [compost metagenome]